MKCPYCGLDVGINGNGVCNYCKAKIVQEDVKVKEQEKPIIKKENTKSNKEIKK